MADTVHTTLGIAGKAACDDLACSNGLVEGQSVSGADIIKAAACGDEFLQQQLDARQIIWQELTLPVATTVTLPSAVTETVVHTESVTAPGDGFLEVQIIARVYGLNGNGNPSSSDFFARLELSGAVSAICTNALVDQVDGTSPGVGSAQSATGVLRIKVPVSSGDAIDIVLVLSHVTDGYDSAQLRTEPGSNNFYEFTTL